MTESNTMPAEQGFDWPQFVRDHIKHQDDVVSSLAQQVEDLKKQVTPDRREFYKAFVKAQAKFTHAEKNTLNDFTKKKYADLSAVIDVIRGPLAENGIVFYQITEDQSDRILGIRTILAHTSGQTIEDVITIAAPKLDPQGIGTCRTYMRRYGLLAICGIAADDDDAETIKPEAVDVPKISKPQVEKLLIKADELFDKRADVALNKMCNRVFNIGHISEIPKDEFDVAMQQLENAAKLMAENEAKKED